MFLNTLKRVMDEKMAILAFTRPDATLALTYIACAITWYAVLASLILSSNHRTIQQPYREMTVFLCSLHLPRITPIDCNASNSSLNNHFTAVPRHVFPTHSIPSLS
jgi:hypothetical protein